MNQYGKDMKKAQVYAEKILLLKKNGFLDLISSKDIKIDERAYIPEISKWYRLHGFRLQSDERETEAALGQTIFQWIRASMKEEHSSAFALLRNGKNVSVVYGTGQADIGAVFKSNIPECEMESIDWRIEGYRYSGIVLGTISSVHFADTIAGSDGLSDCFAACVALPISDSEIQKILMNNRKLISWLDEHKSFQRIYGNATRRVEEIPVPSVIQAIAMLKEENEYLERNRGSGFVHTAVRFGAADREEYRTLASLIQASVSHCREFQAGFEPVRFYELQGSVNSWQECLAIPEIGFQNDTLDCKMHMVSLQDIKSVVSFCLPPVNSYQGYFLKNNHVDENTRDVFPLIKPVAGKGVTIGGVKNTDYDARILYDTLLCHAGVFGATSTGKTTTVMSLLSNVWRDHIPFVVIEAAKKEYASLLGIIPELRVYTTGVDGIPLTINPLQPEDGILIENHVAAVVRSLIAATGGEHPIPEAYEGLLRQTYHQFGWEYGMLAYTDSRKLFPTFKEVFANVGSYIANHAQYGPEVRLNLTAALKLRSENMHSGALGKLFSKPMGLMAKELLSLPSVIELADFSEESATFLMNILMFKFQCYLSHLPEEEHLKRLIVVEEAHNIFRKTLTEDSINAKNNNAFEKMLAEIRSSGTGLILSDQRPSVMPEAVMANTAVKIVHRMSSAQDGQTIGNPMGLSSFQVSQIKYFKKGECIISLAEYPGVQHTQIVPIIKKSGYTAACLICKSRFHCKKTEVQNMLTAADSSKCQFHMAKIEANPYNISLLAQNIDFMLKDLAVTAEESVKCCLLGEILAQHSSVSFQESRIIVNSYAEYLRRSAL